MKIINDHWGFTRECLNTSYFKELIMRHYPSFMQLATPETHMTYYRLHQKLLAQPESESFFSLYYYRDFLEEKPRRAIFWIKAPFSLYLEGKKNLLTMNPYKIGHSGEGLTRRCKYQFLNDHRSRHFLALPVIGFNNTFQLLVLCFCKKFGTMVPIETLCPLGMLNLGATLNRKRMSSILWKSKCLGA